MQEHTNELAVTEKEGQLLMFHTPDEDTEIQVKMLDETVWLTQDQMAILFQKSKSTITEHIQHIFEEGELQENILS